MARHIYTGGDLSRALRRVEQAESALAAANHALNKADLELGRYKPLVPQLRSELAAANARIGELEKKLSYETGLKDSIEGALLAKTAELYPDLRARAERAEAEHKYWERECGHALARKSEIQIALQRAEAECVALREALEKIKEKYDRWRGW